MKTHPVLFAALVYVGCGSPAADSATNTITFSDGNESKTDSVAALKTYQNGCQAIVADATSLYMSTLDQNGGSAQIVAIDPGSGRLNVLADQQTLSPALATDDQYVYWILPQNSDGNSSAEEVRRVGKDGKSAWTTVARVPRDDNDVGINGNQLIRTLAVDDQFVFFTNQATGIVYQAPKAGGAAAVLATTPSTTAVPAFPTAIALDAATVYFVSYSFVAGQSSVLAIDKQGGALRTLMQGDDLETLAVDSNNLYIGSQNQVLLLAKGATTPSVLVATDSTDHEVVSNLVLDDKAVYLERFYFNGLAFQGGTVERVLKTGDAHTVLVQFTPQTSNSLFSSGVNVEYPMGLAVSGATLFATTQMQYFGSDESTKSLGGRILKLSAAP